MPFHTPTPPIHKAYFLPPDVPPFMLLASLWWCLCWVSLTGLPHNVKEGQNLCRLRLQGPDLVHFILLCHNKYWSGDRVHHALRLSNQEPCTSHSLVVAFTLSHLACLGMKALSMVVMEGIDSAVCASWEMFLCQTAYMPWIRHPCIRSFKKKKKRRIPRSWEILFILPSILPNYSPQAQKG